MEGREVVIVEAVRTPVGRGHPEKGYYKDVHPNELLGAHVDRGDRPRGHPAETGRGRDHGLRAAVRRAVLQHRPKAGGRAADRDSRMTIDRRRRTVPVLAERVRIVIAAAVEHRSQRCRRTEPYTSRAAADVELCSTRLSAEIAHVWGRSLSGRCDRARVARARRSRAPLGSRPAPGRRNHELPDAERRSASPSRAGIKEDGLVTAGLLPSHGAAAAPCRGKADRIGRGSSTRRRRVTTEDATAMPRAARRSLTMDDIDRCRTTRRSRSVALARGHGPAARSSGQRHAGAIAWGIRRLDGRARPRCSELDAPGQIGRRDVLSAAARHTPDEQAPTSVDDRQLRSRGS